MNSMRLCLVALVTHRQYWMLLLESKQPLLAQRMATMEQTAPLLCPRGPESQGDSSKLRLQGSEQSSFPEQVEPGTVGHFGVPRLVDTRVGDCCGCFGRTALLRHLSTS